jgi:aryl-alcohol dehydrogenase-like predicted oxidoreductase
VALKWVLQRAPSLAVRAGSVAHLSDDLDMFDFSLDGSDLEGLDAQHGPPGEAGGRCSWGCTE